MRLSSFAIEWVCKLPTTFGRAGWPTHMSLGICDCDMTDQAHISQEGGASGAHCICNVSTPRRNALQNRKRTRKQRRNV